MPKTNWVQCISDNGSSLPSTMLAKEEVSVAYLLTIDPQGIHPRNAAGMTLPCLREQSIYHPGMSNAVPSI